MGVKTSLDPVSAQPNGRFDDYVLRNRRVGLLQISQIARWHLTNHSSRSLHLLVPACGRLLNSNVSCALTPSIGVKMV